MTYKISIYMISIPFSYAYFIPLNGNLLNPLFHIIIVIILVFFFTKMVPTARLACVHLDYPQGTFYISPTHTRWPCPPALSQMGRNHLIFLKLMEFELWSPRFVHTSLTTRPHPYVLFCLVSSSCITCPFQFFPHLCIFPSIKWKL